MLGEKETKVLQIIQTAGPKMPTEIAKILGIDTYITSAILSSLVKSGYIKSSLRKIGSSQIYYVGGQEENVRNMLFNELNDLEKKTLEHIKELKVAFESDLYPQERFLLNDLKDFVTQIKVRLDNGEEITCWKYYNVPEEEMKDIINSRLFVSKKTEAEKPQVVGTPQVVEKPKHEVKVKRAVSSDFSEKVKNYLLNIDAQIVNTIRSKANEVVLIVNIPTIIGSQKFLLFALNKKSISKSDLSKIYIESSKERKPVLLLTINQLSQKVKKFAEEHFGDLLKVIVI